MNIERIARKENIPFNTSSSPKSTDTSFINRFNELPFWRLGFFKCLVDHLKRKSFGQPGVPWMQLLANEIEFDFSPFSISEIKNARNDYDCPVNIFEGICIFLDEFSQSRGHYSFVIFVVL